MAPSRSVSRGRSHSNSQSPPGRRVSSQDDNDTKSARRSLTPPTRRLASRSASKSPERNYRNGESGRGRSRTRSRSPSRNGRRSYRERSYSRSRSRSRSMERGRRTQSSKIVVEKLTKNVNEAHLQEIFGTYGRIESIDLPLNRQFMTNRGTAYIVYEDAAGSEAAIAHMHEAQLDGSVITVSIVLPRRAFAKSPPPIKDRRRPFASPRRGGPPRGPPSIRNRSPPPRRGGYGGRPLDWDDPRRNGRGSSRSASPPASRRRERSHSYSRSPSRTPPRRRAPAARSPPRRRRRSPSYSSYSSYSRSRSRTRTPSRTRYGARR